jgi:hypothetical protein
LKWVNGCDQVHKRNELLLRFFQNCKSDKLIDRMFQYHLDLLFTKEESTYSYKHNQQEFQAFCQKIIFKKQMIFFNHSSLSVKTKLFLKKEVFDYFF